MNSLLQADIFFFISSIGFVAFMIVGLVISFYIIKILKLWLDTSKKINQTINGIHDGIMDVKNTVSDKIQHFSNSSIGQFLMALIEKRFQTEKPKAKKSSPKKPKQTKTKPKPKSDQSVTIDGQSLAQKLKNSDIL